jgi:hypothetical protein
VKSIVDEVEQLGASAERGEMTTREAARKLKAEYPDMTIPGLYEIVKNWRDLRRHYGMPGPYPPPAER